MASPGGEPPFPSLRSVTIVPSIRISDNRAPIWPREPTRREAAVKINFAPGLHVAPGQAAKVSAYCRWTGRWSRLFVPGVISTAEVAPGCRVLDISTGTGEPALMALPAVGASGVVIGTDIAPAMRKGQQTIGSAYRRRATSRLYRASPFRSEGGKAWNRRLPAGAPGQAWP
jgi:hypothetical protein